MKLYSSPGSCAFCSHVVLEEIGLRYEIAFIDLRAGEPEIRTLHALGRVPVLILDDGTVVTQSGVILPYLGRLDPRRKLLPEGEQAKLRVLQWLALLNSDLHPALKMVAGAAHYCADPAGLRATFGALSERYMRLVDDQLADRPWLDGDDMSIADIYAVAAWGWAGKHAPELLKFDHYARMVALFEARPAVIRARAMEAEAVT